MTLNLDSLRNIGKTDLGLLVTGAILLFARELRRCPGGVFILSDIQTPGAA